MDFEPGPRREYDVLHFRGPGIKCGDLQLLLACCRHHDILQYDIFEPEFGRIDGIHLHILFPYFAQRGRPLPSDIDLVLELYVGGVDDSPDISVTRGRYESFCNSHTRDIARPILWGGQLVENLF